MELSNEQIHNYSKRLMLSRMRLLCNNGFYGLLIMHLKFTLNDSGERVWTDGERLFFNPEFLDKLSDDELDYILQHEIMHIALKHCQRAVGFEKERFNIAIDTIVNSMILQANNMDEKSITLKEFGVCIHNAPDGREGYEFSAEELYQLIPEPQGDSESKLPGSKSKANSTNWDDHSKFETIPEELQEEWTQRIINAAETMEKREKIQGVGSVPAYAKRLLNDLKKPQTDWRTILNEFVQEEINDYSFSPPDRRFDDSPFFLPDFNEKEDVVKDVLFMIDTSGSMSDDMITAAFSEIVGAIEQFGGKLTGWLGCFDAAVIDPVPFETIDEFKVIRPYGGGGTRFDIIFNYANEKMQENPPASIIILTDGYAPFPNEQDTNDIPVLWLINNERVEPPFGKVARIKV